MQLGGAKNQKKNTEHQNTASWREAGGHRRLPGEKKRGVQDPDRELELAIGAWPFALGW